MSLHTIIDNAVEEGKLFDVVILNMDEKNALLGRVEVKDWNPDICKTVDYWYELYKPKLEECPGTMEFYRLSTGAYSTFEMKYQNLKYSFDDKNSYLVVSDSLLRVSNYQWYLEYKDKPVPSTIRRAIYKWDSSYNRWNEASKYTTSNINNYTGIRETYDDILRDSEFLTSKSDIMDKLGLSPSINYLISSAPGMGKTSLIKCLATQLNVDIHVIDHKAITTSDPGAIFGSARNTNNINVYIFEDFDRYLKSTKSEQMASLLNALDGVEKMPPSLRFFTTNSRIVGEEFKAFYTRMRRVIHFDSHTDQAYSRSINIVLGNVSYEKQLIQVFKDNCIAMREANQLLVSSITQTDPLQSILHNIALRTSMRNPDK